MVDKYKPWFAHYDKGVPYSCIYPPLSIKQMFNSCAEANPDRDYLIINDTHLPYGLVNTMARKAANALVTLGVKKGDRVAIMAPNVPQYVIAFQACAKLGAIVVPVNPLAAAPEVHHYINDSGAETLIVLAAFAKGPIEVFKAKDTPLRNVIAFQLPSMSIEVESGPGIHDFNDLVGAAADSEPDIDVHPADVLLLQYTGGTTGLSKGCVLTNANLVAIAYQENYWMSPLVSNDDELRCLAAIPLYHIYGFNLNVNINHVHGGTIILVPQPSTDNILDAINKHQPNFFTAVPTMIIGLNQHPDITTSKIGAIKGIVSGSAPLPVEAMRTFEMLSGGVITEGYGMSETSNIVTANPTQTVRKPGGVGMPFPDNDVRIVDLETGTTDMPLGEPGEIIAKGPSIMREYWNNPEETAKVLRDGWLSTGDIGYMDSDGHIFIVDRKKDMVLSSGFNVYPREIDELMFTHPKVLQACSFGIPDPTRGECLKLAIVLKPDVELTADEVRTFCKENLSGYKVPREVVFVDELPLTPIGKPDRKKLRQLELEGQLT
ncbi:CoA ligase [Mycolicibacterium cyprinidarum]|uniref:CoA ligase n=1 Tax=Mycolicibacterium cyprinidarum TaxID=2860311 RepID=A0ABQ4V4F2_9MYCO|nr:CoA ligase [Mycolicibacterium sp. NGTWSNA01]GJF15499.1 CoA ligase [Mycolicibacterium sp. NGTWS0302]